MKQCAIKRLRQLATNLESGVYDSSTEIALLARMRPIMCSTNFVEYLPVEIVCIILKFAFDLDTWESIFTHRLCMMAFCTRARWKMCYGTICHNIIHDHDNFFQRTLTLQRRVLDFFKDIARYWQEARRYLQQNCFNKKKSTSYIAVCCTFAHDASCKIQRDMLVSDETKGGDHVAFLLMDQLSEFERKQDEWKTGFRTCATMTCMGDCGMLLAHEAELAAYCKNAMPFDEYFTREITISDKQYPICYIKKQATMFQFAPGCGW